MGHQPHPNASRALRHLVRGHRIHRQTRPASDDTPRVVYSYDGVMSAGIAKVVQRLLRKDLLLRRHR